MTTFTLVATGTATTELANVEESVRATLAAVGVQLIDCAWAPDVDTIADAVGQSVTLLDLN